MVNISKKDVSPRVKKFLYTQLSELFIANTQKSEFTKTLYELLSPSERIMLAKRVGIIGLLVEGYSTYEISNTFNVSVATVLTIQEKLERGSLPHIANIFKRKKARAHLLHIVGELIAFGLPGNPQKLVRTKIRRDIEAWRAGGE